MSNGHEIAMALLLGAPLLAAALVPLVGGYARSVSGSALTLVAVCAALLASAEAPGAGAVALGGWAAPLGIAMRAEPLGLGLVMLSAGLMAALSWVRLPGADGSGFWAPWCLTAAGLSVVFLTQDLFNAYVALELLGISAVALVLAGKGEAAVAGALRYLLAGLTGSALYLLGVAIVYLESGALDIGILAGISADTPGRALAMACMSAGLLIKAAAFPFHGWLPPAHSSAPAPASAVLSGLVLKAAVFLLWRLWAELGPADAAALAAPLFGVLGAAAIGWGSLGAFTTTHLKALLAYSTIAQIGFLLLVTACIAGGHPQALGAGLLLLVGHALGKAAAFVAVGALMVTLQAHTITDLKGAAARAPLLVFALALSALALVGLPPSAGFAGKWALLQIGMATGQWPLVGVVAAGTLASAAYLLRPLAAALEGAGDGHGRRQREVSAIPALALSAVAALSLPVGYWTATVLAGLPVPGGAS